MNNNKESDSFEIQLTEGNISSKSSSDNNIVIPLNEPEENLRHENLNNMEIVVKLDNIKKNNHKKKSKHLRKEKDSKNKENNNNNNNNNDNEDNNENDNLEKKSVKKKLSHVEIRLKKIIDSAFDYNNLIATKEDNYNIYRKFLQRKLIKNYERTNIISTFLNIQFLPRENLFLNEKKNTNNDTKKNVYKAIRTGPKANQEVLNKNNNNNNNHRTINVNSNHKISNNYNNNLNINEHYYKINLNPQLIQNNNNNNIKNNTITISSNGKSTVHEAKNNNINKPKVITVRSNAIINKIENNINNTLEIKEEIKNSSNLKTDLINLETINKKDEEKINKENNNNNVNNNENKEEEKPKKYKVITVRS